MTLSIQEMNENNVLLLDSFDNSFISQSRLVPFTKNGFISYYIEDIPPFTKQYPPEGIDARSYLGRTDRVAFFAFINELAAGQVRLRIHWNRLVYIEDLAVDVHFRRRGVGQALLQRAIQWAQEKNFPGLMLETQDINVGACKLYEKCGFTLSGFDRCLYMALPEVCGEIALYWYYPLRKENP